MCSLQCFKAEGKDCMVTPGGVYCELPIVQFIYTTLAITAGITHGYSCIFGLCSLYTYTDHRPTIASAVIIQYMTVSLKLFTN